MNAEDTSMALLNKETQISTLVEGLDHPEGIAWGLDGHVYAGKLAKFTG